MPSIGDVPSELVHILARFAPLAVAQLARSNCAFWIRFAHDARLWAETVRWVRRREQGRALVDEHSDRILARCPALNDIVPRVVALRDAKIFAVSPDGQMVACAVPQSPVRVVAADPPHRLLACLQTGNASHIAFSESWLAVQSVTRITLFECATWTRTATLITEAMSFAVLNDDVLVSGTRDGAIVLWSVATTAPKAARDGVGVVSALAAHKTADMFASGRENGSVELWSSGASCLYTMRGHVDVVHALAFDDAGARLASASWDDAVRVWSVASGACLHVFNCSGGVVMTVAISSTGLMAMALRDTNLVCVVRLGEGGLRSTISVAEPFLVHFPRGEAPSLFYSNFAGALFTLRVT